LVVSSAPDRFTLNRFFGRNTGRRHLHTARAPTNRASAFSRLAKALVAGIANPFRIARRFMRLRLLVQIGEVIVAHDATLLVFFCLFKLPRRGPPPRLSPRLDPACASRVAADQLQFGFESTVGHGLICSRQPRRLNIVGGYSTNSRSAQVDAQELSCPTPQSSAARGQQPHIKDALAYRSCQKPPSPRETAAATVFRAG